MDEKILGQLKMEVPYFQAPNEIFEKQLSIYELATYLYLARCGNNGGTAFPSYNTIATKCNMSRRKAIDVVQTLIDKGFLFKESRQSVDDNKNFSNIYYVNHNISGAQHALPSAQDAPPPSAQDAPPSAQHAPYKELNINKQLKKEINNICSPVQDNTQTTSSKEIKHKYGEYTHVKLTDKEYSKLIEDFGEDIIKVFIKKVDEYCEQYGKSYKNYSLTIRKWISNDKNNNKTTGGNTDAAAGYKFGMRTLQGDKVSKGGK